MSGHDKVVVRQMNCVHGYRVKFLSSPGFPGLGIGTVLRQLADLVARVSQSLISSPFLIKTKHPLKEGIFDLWGQR